MPMDEYRVKCQNYASDLYCMASWLPKEDIEDFEDQMKGFVELMRDRYNDGEQS